MTKKAATSSTPTLQLAVIGLGTMGANVARNAAHHGAAVAVYNRTKERTKEFMDAHASEGNFMPAETLEDLVNELAAPRKVLLMVKAGDAVDAVLDELLPLLKKGDILIDGGNSHFADTIRRDERCRKKGIFFVGMGISGGEEGALKGPSIMPGGSPEAYEQLAPILTAIAADDGAGGKCVAHIGQGASGHFVKMVHNGIEYGLMQLIAETYDVLKSVGDVSNEKFGEMYASWNTGVMESFLLEITAKIFPVKDPETGEAMIDVIKDAAGQKGTGKWTTEAAMSLGVAIPTITAAVDARIMSAHITERKKLSVELPEALPEPMQYTSLSELAKDAYACASICSYLQGFDLLEAASEDHKWNLNLAEVARIWRGGCIIRSGLLPLFQEFFADADARHKVFDLFMGKAQQHWRNFVLLAAERGIPAPAMSASLAWYDSVRRKRLPQNLVQAQRDFFGAHTYERLDREGVFHTQWEA